MRRLALAAALAALALTALPASAADPPLLVVGFSKIGTFTVSGGTPAAAFRAFGKPTRTHETKSFCEHSWPGLRISFYTLLDRKQCLPGTPFESATITRNWVTDRGLRKGDPVAKAKALYPSARKAKAGAANIDLVVRFSQAIGPYGLTGRVSNGRVTALDILDPQGGE